jgi:hypothetical protein
MRGKMEESIFKNLSELKLHLNWHNFTYTGTVYGELHEMADEEYFKTCWQVTSDFYDVKLSFPAIDMLKLLA